MNVRGQIQDPSILFLGVGKPPGTPLSWELDGPVSWSVRFGREKNLLYLTRVEPGFQDCSAVSPVTKPTIAALKLHQ
jgi:hypothetical protein